MKVPSRVKVGYRDFDIKLQDLNTANAGDDVFGLCAKDKGILFLDENQDKQQLAETTLHEVLHGIWAVFGLDKREEEENAVSKLSIGLAGVIRDNPKFLKWLAESLESK